MAWSVLQSNNGTSSSGTTVTSAYSSNLSSGTTMLAFVILAGASQSVSTVKDTAGNSFTLISSVPTFGTSSTGTMAVYGLDTPAGDVGGTTTITVTMTGTNNGSALLIQEVSGLAAVASIADGTRGQNNLHSQSVGFTITPSAYSSTAANEYLISFYGDDGDSGSWASTAPGGYTADSHNISGNSTSDVGVAYKNSTNGSETGAWTVTAGSAQINPGVLLLALKLGAGTTPSTILPQPGSKNWRRRHRRVQQIVQVPSRGPIYDIQSNLVVNTASVSSNATTLGTGVQLGNLVVAEIATGASGNTLTGPGAPWTQAGSTISGTGIETSIWYMVVGAGQVGQTTWTWTSATGHTWYTTIREWVSQTGWPANPLDQTASANDGGSTGTSFSSGTTATTSQPLELWVASLAYKGSAQAETGPSAPWVIGLEPTFAGNNTMREVYQVVTATGTANATMTVGSAQDWAGMVATFSTVASGNVTAGLASATGAALTPGIGLTPGLATGTGAANTPGLGLTIGLAGATGAAQAVGGGRTTGLATGTGTAQFAGMGLGLGLASGVGAANAPNIGLTPGLATGAGAGQNAQSSIGGNAGLASGTGGANTPGIGLTTGLASGTGAAQAVGGGWTTGLATGTGAAQFAGVGCTPGLATAVGAALAPGIGLTPALATGTGTAQQAQNGQTNTAGLASGTGAARAPTFGLTPGLSTGTGAAQAVGGGLTAGLSTGAGAAQFAGVGLTPGLATGVGTAGPVTVGSGLMVNAGLASATGAALTPGIGLTPGLATGTGAAQAVGGGWTTGLSSGTGTAQFAGTGLTPGLATGTGTAQAPVASSGSSRPNVDFTGSTLVIGTLGGTLTVSPNTLSGTCTPINTLGGTCTPIDTLGGTCTLVAYGGTLSVTSDTLTGTLSVAVNPLSGTDVTDKMQEVDITLNEFNDATVTFQIKNNGSPMDITGYTVNALFKKSRGDLDNAGTTKTYSSGGGSPKITVNTPSTGSCTLAIPETDMIAPVWTFYRIDIVSGGGVQTTAIFGIVTVTTL